MQSPTGRLSKRLLWILGPALAVAGVALASAAGAHPGGVIAILALTFLAVCAAAWFPLRSLGRRFDELRGAAEAMARGDLGARVPVDAHDDLAITARALNEVAARLEAELEALRRERDASEALLANLPQGLALLSRDLTIRYANARFWSMVGLPPPGGAALPRLPTARQPILEQLAEECIRGGRAVTSDIALYVEEKREFEVTVAPIATEPERPPESWLLSIEDLRPEKRMVALRREFVANASHELKTPLTSIRGYAETLLSGGLEDTENRARFVETIRAQAARLEALVEDLLALADLERPDAPLERKDWDVGQIVREIGATFDDLAARRGLRLVVEARPGVRARVDRKRLDLALRNLLDNAIKYTDVGTVTIRLERTASAIRVSVSDTGRGIETEHLPRLFERFYRVDRGRSRALGGTGLGLSIVKHAIQLHGGRVGVESKAGEGSTFWIEVPPDGPHLQS